MSPLDPRALPASEIPGVGPRHIELLARLGLVTVFDLLNFRPKRYEDRRYNTPLDQAEDDQMITVRGKVHHTKSVRWRGRPVFEAVIAPMELRRPDDVITARWFGRFDLPRKLQEGVELFLFGKIKRMAKGGWTMSPTEFEVVERDSESYIHIERLTPIYPLTEGLYARVMRSLMYHATQTVELDLSEFYDAPVDLLPLHEAYRKLHFPDSQSDADAAIRRLAFDEFLIIQCIVALRRRNQVSITKIRAATEIDLVNPWLASLPFQPTGAQRRAMSEIEQDLGKSTAMNRLLQGDVGSGKTLVAAFSMLRAVERGEQAALMAPTQILAEQHASNLRRWMEPLGIEVQLFTGNNKPASRLQKLQGSAELFAAEAYQEHRRGSIIVGTHALLFDRYASKNLGLIVIDEQHKFGVLQRQALSRKGNNPDILVMTATPIPRTLGMTIYGDLDCSTLDELPPGRLPIRTVLRSEKELSEFWKFLKQQISEGRQGYVVYPLVEASEKVEAKAVKAEVERIRVLLPGVKIGLLHGQLAAQEKERVMEEFRLNITQVLVSTTVVEVGVDVSNANVMLIENAERFGLAQLHQLRGRVGRGKHISYCVLVGDPKSFEGWRRLKIMERTTDGFVIAEEDLDIRGEGNILGTEQSGMPPLRFGRLKRDGALMVRARELANELTLQDPTLKTWAVIRSRVMQSGGASASLIAVS